MSGSVSFITHPDVAMKHDHQWTCGYCQAMNRIRELEAENAKLQDESQRDYDEMRKFQAKFISADQERDSLRAEVESMKADQAQAVRIVRAEYIRSSEEAAKVIIELRAEVKRLRAQQAHPEVKYTEAK